MSPVKEKSKFSGIEFFLGMGRGVGVIEKPGKTLQFRRTFESHNFSHCMPRDLFHMNKTNLKPFFLSQHELM